MSTSDRSGNPVAVVLAAGKGTRMRSRRPKVLHEVAGKPILAWVIEAARASGCEQCLVVVGHGTGDLKRAFADEDIVWVEQREQLGTGHALAQVRELVGDAHHLLVLSGDVPAVRAKTLERLLSSAATGWGAIATARMERPGSLGRVVMKADGVLERIVEAADATEQEMAIRTVNAGLYVLPAAEIFDYLAALQPDNAKGELYLTDALGAAAREREIKCVAVSEADEALGVNDRADLARAHRVLMGRGIEALMEQGVTIYDSRRVVIEPSVRIGPDSEIHPEVTLTGDTQIGRECVVHSGAWIRHSSIGDGSTIGPHSVLDGAVVGDGATIGPFARLRPGTEIGRAVRVGNFVEIKNARLGDGVKAGHLSYLGDAEIGDGANIGAGTVTCNYDGRKKHKTTIGKRAFIGSDTMLVAPVEVGDDAVTGAGSVITNDIPGGALAVGRVRQRTIEDWVKRRKRKDEE
ncbi:MAG: bifunctional UDP-N-acetylglucosamine diphosphorylase/glucosamine-1-phosphate N-acetyltransferase GlmU [Acidobacteriota bacterium]|nr:bifunctional UDP-N-acetylglucosamine diphosphorylase/glucosamine-1-phosphate N-acetyltransferase GlmU [Acidobacteriota bacterium]